MELEVALLYRLLRAQAAIGLLSQDASVGFVLTRMGDLLRTAHPASLATMARLEGAQQHYALRKHLPAMVKDGKPTHAGPSAHPGSTALLDLKPTLSFSGARRTHPSGRPARRRPVTKSSRTSGATK
jgi:hypothetical protein